MQLYEIILTALALAMDAFAVAICKGLATPKLKPKHLIITGAWFGGFQGLMPVLGYIPVRLVGPTVEKYVTQVAHWVAFVLLAFLGVKMIYEALSAGEDECVDCSFAPRVMVVMAIATSIDALAVGVTLALTEINIVSTGFSLVGLDINIIISALIIGVITFLLSAVGVKIGNVFGAKYKHYAELAGGIVLLLIGVKILLEHLGVLAF